LPDVLLTVGKYKAGHQSYWQLLEVPWLLYLASCFNDRTGTIADQTAVLTGWLCDKIHLRRWPFLGALVIQLAATLMLCLATSVGILVAARILQGASGGVVWTVSLIIMTDTVQSAELGQALGYVALGRSVGVVIGPLLGGVLYERSGYYSVFALCFAFLVIDGFFRLSFIEA
jgi:MFS family permease